MSRSTPLLRPLLIAFFGVFSALLSAHSIPDVPVRGSFQTGGEAEITIEINPRNWAESPKMALSLEQKEFLTYTPEQREELLKKTRAWVATYLEFTLEPIGRVQPDFTYDFIAETGKPLMKMDDAVVARGRWKTKIPAGVTGWKVRSLPGHKVATVFTNSVDGKEHPRFMVMFPGETSFTFDLTGLAAKAPTGPTPGSVGTHSTDAHSGSTFLSYLKQGFEHILPEGLDHILFVLGLFLLCRAWKPILIQVTTFTAAHTITLALATLGYVSADLRIVEAIIAASITIVALENIFRPSYGKFRLLMVFGFGLIHGLGFAQRLIDERIPEGSLGSALLGFNVGVELGQLAVIGLAIAATFWIKDDEKYRKWVVIPASVLIALAGIYWAMERLGVPITPSIVELLTFLKSFLS
jgi:hydrogenase/urease accessory protein HupE